MAWQLVVLLALALLVSAQTTISTGSIKGPVMDPTGAVVSNAKITITNKDTRLLLSTVTTTVGAYTFGAIVPGDYLVRIVAPGSKAACAGRCWEWAGLFGRRIEVDGSD